ncbi:MAG TPA: hypothetical protein V6C90_23780 [Coleofasciculaceae cyanobacterium]
MALLPLALRQGATLPRSLICNRLARSVILTHMQYYQALVM